MHGAFQMIILIHMEEEFDEEEVWDALRVTKDDSPKKRKQKEAAFSSQSALMKMPRPNVVGEQSRHSAPVEIPNWSKIHQQSGSVQAAVDGRRNAGGEDDDNEMKLPPHEWLARKMEKIQLSSSPACDRAGMTLKGRDQRKVSDAVLTKTGFFE